MICGLVEGMSEEHTSKTYLEVHGPSYVGL